MSAAEQVGELDHDLAHQGLPLTHTHKEHALELPSPVATMRPCDSGGYAAAVLRLCGGPSQQAAGKPQ